MLINVSPLGNITVYSLTFLSGLVVNLLHIVINTIAITISTIVLQPQPWLL